MCWRSQFNKRYVYVQTFCGFCILILSFVQESAEVNKSRARRVEAINLAISTQNVAVRVCTAESSSRVWRACIFNIVSGRLWWWLETVVSRKHQLACHLWKQLITNFFQLSVCCQTQGWVSNYKERILPQLIPVVEAVYHRFSFRYCPCNLKLDKVWFVFLPKTAKSSVCFRRRGKKSRDGKVRN